MNNYPDMDEMIEECKKKQKPSEEIVFAVGAGRIAPKIGKKKAMGEAMNYIKSLDGFIGVYPVDLWHTLLIFDSLNNAKGARNGMKIKGIGVGNVIPILVEKQYINKED